MVASKEHIAKVARTALKKYDFPGEVTLTGASLKQNVVIDVSVPSEGRRLALRLHRRGYRSEEQLSAELRLLDEITEPLAEQDVVLPKPIPTRDGALFVSVPSPAGDEADDPILCDIAVWVEGTVLRPGRGLGFEEVALLGRSLAHLHNATYPLTSSLGRVLPRWDVKGLFSEESPFDPGTGIQRWFPPGGFALYCDVVDAATAAIGRLSDEQNCWGIVHGDFVLGNCRFADNVLGRTLGVLDFDECGTGFLVTDLAAILGNLIEIPDERALRSALWSAYTDVRSVPAELTRHLPTLMAARHATQCLCFIGAERHGTVSVAKEHIMHRIAEMEACLAIEDVF